MAACAYVQTIKMGSLNEHLQSCSVGPDTGTATQTSWSVASKHMTESKLRYRLPCIQTRMCARTSSLARRLEHRFDGSKRAMSSCQIRRLRWKHCASLADVDAPCWNGGFRVAWTRRRRGGGGQCTQSPCRQCSCPGCSQPLPSHCENDLLRWAM